ncbi:glycosyltransferase family 2 protein [Dactylosporangium sp. NBC_01737]|uniref:glycosyltransferase n=1 Tax=Dactylosporangium sp. NBC_01737 TaxID=2975959 RepID=UPI002E139206|nr:glycosyltransferase family 2 protein [Dactylosporangium sp. NBC_01737]
MLSIGVAARNEEATVAQTLRSIEVALSVLPAPVPAEIIVAVNGCTDRTREVVEDYAAVPRGGVTIQVIESAPGLIEAQRAIVRLARSEEHLILVDADCVLDPGCLRELIRVMAEHPEAEAAWASMVPADHDGRPGFLRVVYNFADYHPDVIHRGRHLCGRAFAVRHYDVAWRPVHRTPDVDPRTAAYLSLERGPMSDDSYLSRVIIDRHGPGAIRHAAAARVHFQPIPRLRDFSLAQHRKTYEARRLDLLFPEYRGVRGRHFRRRIDPAGYARLRPVQRLQCRLYVLLYALSARLAAVRLAAGLALLRLGVPLRPCEVWPVVEGTKRAFTSVAAPRPPAPPA